MATDLVLGRGDDDLTEAHQFLDDGHAALGGGDVRARHPVLKQGTQACDWGRNSCLDTQKLAIT